MSWRREDPCDAAMKVIASWFQCQSCKKPCFPVHLREQSFSQCCGARMDPVWDQEIEESLLPAWLKETHGQPATKAV
jgi:hypothetical protein